MSAVLLELVEPYLYEAKALEELRILMSLGALAWNMSILPDADRRKGIRGVARKLKGEEALIQAMLEELIARKLHLFPDDTRSVVDCKVTESGGKYHVIAAVIATEPADPGGTTEAGGRAADEPRGSWVRRLLGKRAG